MKVLILGAGSLGSVFGGFLAKKNEVSMVGREWHLGKVREQGLRISGIWGDFQVKNLRVYTSLDEMKGIQDTEFDLIFVSVKSYDTSSVMKEYFSLMSKENFVISIQNGLGNAEVISSFVGEERTVLARVIFGAEIFSPGCVKVTVCADKVMLGGLNNRMEYSKVKKIAEMLTSVGIESEATLEIDKYIWAKVLYNSTLNPLSAILEVTYGELGEEEQTRWIIEKICHEIFEVTKAHKIELFWDEPEEYLNILFNKEIPQTSTHYSSMLQDIKRGKKTEIDALNGAIVRLAKKVKVKVPVNEVITRLVRFKERRKC
jgi:2-dehydropantoate 2-reductase